MVVRTFTLFEFSSKPTVCVPRYAPEYTCTPYRRSSQESWRSLCQHGQYLVPWASKKNGASRATSDETIHGHRGHFLD